jgi:N6-adenosine-specific RNA methylase IME4
VTCYAWSNRTRAGRDNRMGGDHSIRNRSDHRLRPPLVAHKGRPQSLNRRGTCAGWSRLSANVLRTAERSSYDQAVGAERSLALDDQSNTGDLECAGEIESG